ncbi:glycosyltransferase [Rhodocaloribacter sp.]
MVHNFYQEPGGEDQVFAAETALLEARGHRVIRYTVHNDAVDGMSRVALAKVTLWNGGRYRELRALFRRERPEVVHFHNTLPLVSPAAYYAAHAEGAAVVQTLHNFRLLCPKAVLYRDGRVCEDCLPRTFAWPGVRHACYRGSRPATAMVAAMVSAHRLAGTWAERVDVYVALTEFAKRKHIEGGLNGERIAVKPNFAFPDPGRGRHEGRFALFVGRLSEEKGVDLLFDAWARKRPRIPLKIIGAGEGTERAMRASAEFPDVEYLGRQPRDVVLEHMKNAAFLVFPSNWYEGFPMTIVEAYATGLPVIAGDLGSMATLVRNRQTGLVFEPGSVEDLVRKIEWAWEHEREVTAMGEIARETFEGRYTAGRNYEMLMAIYEQAKERRRRRSGRGRHG